MDPAADGTAKLAFRGNRRLTLRRHVTGQEVEAPESRSLFGCVVAIGHAHAPVSVPLGGSGRTSAAVGASVS